MIRVKGSLLLACLALAACGADEEEDSVVLPAHCNPLSTDSCMLPWPSSFYLKQDGATGTGYRVSYPLEAMPVNRDNKPQDNSRYNLCDGFSIGSQIVAFFKEGVSDEGLPTDQVDLSGSVTGASLVSVMAHPSGERVPLFVELDANVKGDETPVLLIRPQRPLAFDTRYVVVLRRGIKDGAGALLEAPEPFARLRDGRGTSSKTLETERERIEEVLDWLGQQSVPPDDLVLAWDFHTASREAVTGNVVGMVDEALAKLDADGPKFTVTNTRDFEAGVEPYLMREIEGEMEVPSFLDSDALDARLNMDAAGKPVYRGLQKFPFIVHIPRCAEQATGPLPLLIFGPGLFADPYKTTNEEYNKHFVQDLCMVQITAEWRGLSSVDTADVAAKVIPDFSNLPRLTDHLQQAHVNFQVLTELARGKLLEHAALRVNGTPVSDAQQPIYYLGISNGGIQGVGFAALSRHIERFVLHVPGGWWSQMIQRSSNFALLAVLMEKVYTEALDRALLVSMSQHIWDYTDPISFVGFVKNEPLPGRKAKKVVMQESRYDDQVPNIATRAVARGIGLPQLTPNAVAIYGLEQKSGPLEHGLAQWDVDPPSKPPKENLPAFKPEPEDSAHDIPRRTQVFRDQLKAFFKPDGKLVHVCSGICDPD